MEPGRSTGWSLERFLKTLCYFDAIPLPSLVRRWFGAADGGAIDRSTVVNAAVDSAAVLVISGGGALGPSIVQVLQTGGYEVRSLRVSHPQDPASDHWQEALARSSAAVVIGADLPTTVEVLTSVVEALQRSAPYTRIMLFDFTQPEPDLRPVWGALDDVVMGGVSESGLSVDGTVGVFSGLVSTANSGGFASVRTRNLEPPLDLSQYDGIELTVRGDGQRYKFLVRCENRWDGVAYSTSFDTVRDRWLTIRLPFDAMIPVFRAKTARQAGGLNRAGITSLQLMLSKFEYDGSLNPHFQPGTFSLQVASITAYKANALVPVLVSDGSTQAEQQAILSYLGQQGITVIPTSPDRLLEEVRRSMPAPSAHSE